MRYYTAFSPITYSMSKTLTMILGSGVSPKPRVSEIHKHFMREQGPIEWSIDDSFRRLYRLVYAFCEEQLGKNNANYEHVLEFCSQYNRDSLLAKSLKALAGGELVDKSIFKDDVSERLPKLAEHMKIKLKLILETNKKDKKHDEEHLSLIEKIIDSKEYTTINILTLNHDTVIEKYLESIGCEFNEPFKVLDFSGYDVVKAFDAHKVGDWMRELQEKSNGENKPMINLIKLHGSIDWFFLYYSKNSTKNISEEPEALERFETLIRCRLNLSKKLESGENIYENKDGKDNIYYYLSRRNTNQGSSLIPAILVGTESKRSGSDTYYHAKMFQIAHLLMEETEHLLVSGYGGRDPGITQIIHNWIFNKKIVERKMCIIDYDAGAIKRILKTSLLAGYINMINFLKYHLKESENEIDSFIMGTLFANVARWLDEDKAREITDKIKKRIANGGIALLPPDHQKCEFIEEDQTNEEVIESVLDEYIQLFIDKAIDEFSSYTNDDKLKIRYLKKKFNEVDFEEISETMLS